MKLSLVVLTPGKMQGQILEIKLPQFLVGRDPQCHLRPASALISKRHCALLQRDGKAFVRDFDSTNGTSLNDQPVKGEVELHHDDQLKIGPLLFGVRIEATAPVNRPTPPPPTRAPVTKAVAKPDAPAKPAAKPAAPTVSTPTPPPATEPKPEPAGAAASTDALSGDDDIAAMLLSLQDDGPSSAGLTSNEVPEGSTVHDLTVTPDMLTAAKNEKDRKEKEAAAAKAKAAAANTASAAKTILDKYMKRPRSQG
jgi:predicted component of type VI protein secretion system